MSNKLHCDICDKVLDRANKGGHVEATPLHGWADGNQPMDLCLDHYNSYKYAVRQWKRKEQP